MNSHQTNTDKIFSSVTCGADLRITVSTARVTGSRHRKNRQPCQDTVLTRADGNFLFCGLADGQSGTEYGREGGLASLEAVADHIDRTGIEELLDSPFPDELPCGIVRAFRAVRPSVGKPLKNPPAGSNYIKKFIKQRRNIL